MAAEVNRYVLAIFSVVVALTLCGGFLVADKEWLHWYADQSTLAPSEPDRVVGIEAKCDIQPVGARWEAWGYYCNHFGTTYPGFSDESVASYSPNGKETVDVFNRRQVLTIRTTQGTAYTIAIPISQKVTVGDPWPPK